MYWLQLTQATTGATVYVNMEHVAVISPSRVGGSNLILVVTETHPRGGRDAARSVTVQETTEEIMDMISRTDEP